MLDNFTVQSVTDSSDALGRVGRAGSLAVVHVVEISIRIRVVRLCLHISGDCSNSAGEART